MWNLRLFVYFTVFCSGVCCRCICRLSSRLAPTSAACVNNGLDAVAFAGIVLFSALPFAAVQALADSKYGKDLLARVEQDKPKLEARKRAVEAARSQARQRRYRCDMVPYSALVWGVRHLLSSLSQNSVQLKAAAVLRCRMACTLPGNRDCRQ
jgi:hypothetical protein